MATHPLQASLEAQTLRTELRDMEVQLWQQHQQWQQQQQQSNSMERHLHTQLRQTAEASERELQLAQEVAALKAALAQQQQQLQGGWQSSSASEQSVRSVSASSSQGGASEAGLYQAETLGSGDATADISVQQLYCKG